MEEVAAVEEAEGTGVGSDSGSGSGSGNTAQATALDRISCPQRSTDAKRCSVCRGCLVLCCRQDF